MNTSKKTPTRPNDQKTSEFTNLVDYNKKLKQSELTKIYYGNTDAANKEREKLIENFVKAQIAGDTSKIDKFQLDAVKLNVKNPQQLLALYRNAIQKIQNKSKTYRIYNGSGINNTVLQDLRNFKNFRSVLSDIQFNKNEPYNPSNFSSPAKSYMMSANDFLCSDKFDMNLSNEYNLNSEVLPIILNEFQPDSMMYQTELLSVFEDVIGSRVVYFVEKQFGKTNNESC